MRTSPQSLLALAIVPLSATLGFTADTPSATEKRAEKPAPRHSFGREAALADVSKMTPGAGLGVSLFACEPDVVNPCDMDIDERGRVWITEGANYRLSLHTNWGVIREGGDRIQILE